MGEGMNSAFVLTVSTVLHNAWLSGRRTTMCGVVAHASWAGPLQPLVGRLTASGARTPYSPGTAHRISVPGTALLFE